MKKTIVLLLAAMFAVNGLSAQTINWKSSRHSIYFGGGINWFIGDFDRTSNGTDGPSFKLMKENSFSLNVGYKYKLSERFSLRLAGIYSKLQGTDMKSKNPTHVYRGFAFRSNNFDINANIDFYFIKEKEVAGKLRFGQRWSSYIFAGAGLLTYNPRWDGDTRTYGAATVKNGAYLRDIHTEWGDKYHKVTLSVPMGLGLKFLITKKLYLGAEYAVRLTTSDHIDDLHWAYRIEDDAQRALAPAGAVDGAKRGGNEHYDYYATLLFNFGIKFGGSGSAPLQFYHRPKWHH